MEVTSFAPGTFCWMELHTKDPDAAKKLYAEVFGWEAQDDPIGPDMVYTMYKLNGKNAAAMYLDSEPTHPACWSAYISVESADAAAAKAKELGGQIYMEPFDVMEVGRMAVLADPSGAVFSVWQAKLHCGAQVVDEAGAQTWMELMTRDTSAAKAFYGGLFGWTTDESMGEYTMYKSGDAYVGGMMAISEEMGPVPPNWLPYFSVVNADASAAVATANGASVTAGPQDVPGMVRFAVLADTSGAHFGICHPVQG